MKRLFALLLGAVLCASFAHASTPKVAGAFARDEETTRANKVSSDVPKLYAFFKTSGTKKGDSLRGEWFAEDGGKAAPKGTKIDESILTADEDDFSGAFSLDKPAKGWATGKYRVDIYIRGEVASTVNFEIKPGGSGKDSGRGG